MEARAFCERSPLGTGCLCFSSLHSCAYTEIPSQSARPTLTMSTIASPVDCLPKSASDSPAEAKCSGFAKGKQAMSQLYL